MRSWLVLVLLVVLVDYTLGYCHMALLPDGATECVTQDGTVIAKGETHKFTDKCESCTCSADGGPNGQGYLSCCGYGIHAGVMMPPPGCKIVTDDDGCTPKIVQVADETKLC